MYMQVCVCLCKLYANGFQRISVRQVLLTGQFLNVIIRAKLDKLFVHKLGRDNNH